MLTSGFVFGVATDIAVLGGLAAILLARSAGPLLVSGGLAGLCQAATGGSLTKGSSLKGAMVSSVM